MIMVKMSKQVVNIVILLQIQPDLR